MANIDDLLTCPISMSLFHDPVLAEDGYTYEREAIERRIRHVGTSPITNEPLSIDASRPNHTVKRIIDRFENTLREKQYQYTLNVDVQKRKGRPLFQTFGKSIAQAEWLPNNENRPEIVLLKINGARAKQEAALYVNLTRHPNIVRTFGFVLDQDSKNSVTLLQEYAPEGSLDQFLTDWKGPLNEQCLTEIFLQIIDAMSYLVSKGVVHGDLACRNVLVFRFDAQDPSRIVVKVTDFGLSRHSQLYRQVATASRTVLTIVPVRYAAPEIFSPFAKPEDYTEKSDVYAFGVLMWEALSRGAIPWADLSEDDDVMMQIEEGNILPQPEICSARCWSIITKTWSKLPGDRPTFNQLKQMFKEKSDPSPTPTPRENLPSTVSEPSNEQSIVLPSVETTISATKDEESKPVVITERTSPQLIIISPPVSSSLEENPSEPLLIHDKNPSVKSPAIIKTWDAPKPWRSSSRKNDNKLQFKYENPSDHLDRSNPIVDESSTISDRIFEPKDVFNRSHRSSARPNVPHGDKYLFSPEPKTSTESVKPPEPIIPRGRDVLTESPVEPKLQVQRSSSSTRKERVSCIKAKLPALDEPSIGKNKGIDGDTKSSSIDATLFVMFAYSRVFDSLLNMDVNQELSNLQTILKTNIAYILRGKRNLVGHDAMNLFRRELSQVTNDPSFVSIQKDPSEFLQTIERLFHFAPLKIIHPNQRPNPDHSNLTSNILWEIFDCNPNAFPSANIGQLFRNSLSEIPGKLATIPPFLILIAPRIPQSQRFYHYMIPDRQISLDHDILQLICNRCGQSNEHYDASTTFYSCNRCLSEESSSLTNTSIQCLCTSCLQFLHDQLNPTTRSDHSPVPIRLEGFKMNLFAVICVETNHHVAFVKCQQKSHQHVWLFYDNMTTEMEREKTSPSVRIVPQFDRWVDDAQRNKFFFRELDNYQNKKISPTEILSEEAQTKLRLFRDGTFFFYEYVANNNHR